jgi:hypothetical protein
MMASSQSVIASTRFVSTRQNRKRASMAAGKDTGADF